jgi:heat shock protein HtpX
MNTHSIRTRKRENLQQTVLLLGAMALAVTAMGWFLAGWSGIVWSLFAGFAGIVLTPRLSPKVLLRLRGAAELQSWQAPELISIVQQLSDRAGLPARPRLFLVPQRGANAFAVGKPKDAAIGVSPTLLQSMRQRQLVGVLAHEVSHIKNHDLTIMGLAGAIQRLTHTLSWIGLFLLAVNLPLILVGAKALPFSLLLMLLVAPQLSALMMLALSRRREFQADLDAARLTQDPLGLASALDHLERIHRPWWQRLLLSPRVAVPDLLRSHPSTHERVARLRELGGPAGVPSVPAHFRDQYLTLGLLGR